MFTLFGLAARNVARHRRRSLMVGSAIGAVVLLVTVVLGVLHATRAHLYETATVLLSGDLNVDGVVKPTPGRAEPVLADADALAAQLHAELPAVKRIAKRRIGILNVASTRAAYDNMLAIGVDLAAEPTLGRILHLREGTVEGLSQPGGIILSESRAKQLRVKLGDPVVLVGTTHKKAYNALDAKVVGIAPNVGGVMDILAVGSLDTMGRLFGFQAGEVSALQLHLDDPRADLVALQEQVRQLMKKGSVPLVENQNGAPWLFLEHQLENQSWFGTKLLVTRWDEEVGMQSIILTVLDALLGLVTAILLMVACAGLMNALWLAVRERTSEIGTLRAMGMRRGKVVRLFLTEAFLLAVLGGALGTVAGVLTGGALNALNIPVPSVFQWAMGMGEHVRFAMDPVGLAVALVLIVGSSTLVAIFPSYLASRVQPITAMQRIN